MYIIYKKTRGFRFHSERIIFSRMFFAIIFTVFAFSEGAQFPKKWTPCPKSGPEMNECLKSAINFAVQDLAEGNPSLGVLPIDPMHFDTLSINQGSGPVSIQLDFIDMDVTGLKNLKIQKIVNDWKTMEIKYTIPSTLKLDGKYKIKGKILLLPISGDGHFVITMENWKAVAKLKFVEKENVGKKFYEVDKFSFDFDVDKMNMKFENLFNGDKLLGDNMNRFLNQNWKEILNELKPSISKSFSVAYKEISNRIFSKLEIGVVSPE